MCERDEGGKSNTEAGTQEEFVQTPSNAIALIATEVIAFRIQLPVLSYLNKLKRVSGKKQMTMRSCEQVRVSTKEKNGQNWMLSSRL